MFSGVNNSGHVKEQFGGQKLVVVGVRNVGLFKVSGTISTI